MWIYALIPRLLAVGTRGKAASITRLVWEVRLRVAVQIFLLSTIRIRSKMRFLRVRWNMRMSGTRQDRGKGFSREDPLS
jgi:hypothetical protein